MGMLVGQKETIKFREGKPLTAKQAILAQCYICNGEEEGSSEDCKGLSCPLYQFFKLWKMSRPPAGNKAKVPVSA